MPQTTEQQVGTDGASSGAGTERLSVSTNGRQRTEWGPSGSASAPAIAAAESDPSSACMRTTVIARTASGSLTARRTWVDTDGRISAF